MSEISRFALFLAKKHTQNTMHLPEKTFTFCENCRSIIRGFHINNVWNLTFCSIFSEKKTHTQKKHTMHLAEKTVTFSENYCSIIRGSHRNYVWNLTFCSIFGEKNRQKTRCTFLKKMLRFVKIAVL